MTDNLVTATLRDTLTRTAGAVDVPEDPWPGFDRRAGQRRRARRTRRLVAAGVLAALVGIQTNVVPLPGGTPGIAIAAPPSALVDAPTRGSLAGDRAWLGALRTQVGAEATDRLRKDPEGIWEIDRKKIRVLYASDLPEARIALVLVPLRLGVLTRSSLVWYTGPAGADAGQLRYGGHSGAGDDPVATLIRETPAGGSFAVVIGPPGSTVTISDEPDYRANGTLGRRQLATSDGPGVGVASSPTLFRFQPLVRVTQGDELLHEALLPGGPYGPVPSAPQIEAIGTAAVRDARGSALDRAVLTNFVDVVIESCQLPVAGLTVRLVWSGTVDGQAAALFTARPAGGGVIAYALHGTESSSMSDLKLLLPAEGAERRPIGWRLRADGAHPRTDRVLVVAPAEAARATVTINGGAQVPVELDSAKAGSTRVPPDQPATVTAYAADGSVLGSTPVPSFAIDMSGLPGASPETRVVP